MGSFLENVHVKWLERKLNKIAQEGKSFEVINAGHYGYHDAHELMFFLREGIRYNPDLLLKMYTGEYDDPEYVKEEDGRLKFFYRSYSVLQRRIRKIVVFLRTHTHLGSFLLDRIMDNPNLRRYISRLVNPDLFIPEERERYAVFPEWHPKVANIDRKTALGQKVIFQAATASTSFTSLNKLIFQEFAQQMSGIGGKAIMVDNWSILSPQQINFLQRLGISVCGITLENPQGYPLERPVKKDSYDKFLVSHRFGYGNNEIVANEILKFLIENNFVKIDKKKFDSYLKGDLQ